MQLLPARNRSLESHTANYHIAKCFGGRGTSYLGNTKEELPI